MFYGYSYAFSVIKNTLNMCHTKAVVLHQENGQN